MKLNLCANGKYGKCAAQLAAISVLFSIAYFSMAGEKPVHVQKLADGSIVRIYGISAGKKLHTFYGFFWQKPLFLLFENILPPKIRGYGRSYPSSFAQGSVGLEFVHAVLNPVQNNSLLMSNLTNEIHGTRRTYDVIFEPQSGSAAGIVLYSLWEFPRVPDKNLCIKYFPNTNSTDHVEFSIPNPYPL